MSKMDDINDRIAEILIEDHVALMREVQEFRIENEALMERNEEVMKLRAGDEALLRQALEALEAVVSDDQPFLTRSEAVIAAIRERLGEPE